MSRLECNPRTQSHTQSKNCPVVIKQKIEEKKKTTEIGTDCTPQRARGYSMQQHRNSSNFSTTTKICCDDGNPIFLSHSNFPTRTHVKRIH
jgi:uncharacterized protein (DUF779 family)